MTSRFVPVPSPVESDSHGGRRESLRNAGSTVTPPHPFFTAGVGTASPHAGDRAAYNVFSADFWLEVLFWWTEHAPRVVWWTRGFFLFSAWQLCTSMRKNTLANARRVVGDSASDATCVAVAKGMIRSFYVAIYELGIALRVSRDQLSSRIDSIEGRERYVEARGAGRGAVIVTAHLGCFELGIAALVEQERRMHVVFRRDRSLRFERLRSRLRAKIGVCEAPVDEGWPTWSHLRDALANDEVVMIQGDRVMPGQKGVAVPFLGGRLLIPTGPLKLAMIAGSPVIPVFSIRTAVGRLRIVVEKPIVVTREEGAFDAQHPAVRQMAAAIEKNVRSNPAQWLMLEPLCFAGSSEDLGAETHVR